MKIKEVLTKDFLEIMLRKLKVGDAKSIYFNAFPGKSASKLGLKELDVSSEGAGQEFLTKLFSKKEFDICFSIGRKIDEALDKETIVKENKSVFKRIENIIYAKNDSLQDHGVETFGFGYPILSFKTNAVNGKSKVIQSPILIWNLNIKRDGHNKFRLIKNDDFSITVNELLIEMLNSEFGIKIDSIGEGVLEDGIVDIKEINDLCKNISDKLHIPHNEIVATNLKSIPDKKKISETHLKENAAVIIEGGVFGLFKSQNQSIIKDLSSLCKSKDNDGGKSGNADNHNEIKLTPITYKHSFGSVDTDPTQQKILNAMPLSESIIIQGPPGTGKSQTITALITNALDNGKTCLVVCEKKTALDVIYKNLSEIGLQDLCVVIDDVDGDRTRIVDFVRSISNKNKPFDFNSDVIGEKYDFYNEKIVQKEESILKIHGFKNDLRSVKRSIAGYLLKNWKDIVGTHLKLGKNLTKRTTLEKTMKESVFNYTDEEYNRYSLIINSLSLNYDKEFKNSKFNHVAYSSYCKKNYLEAKEFFDDVFSKICNSFNLIRVKNERLITRDVSGAIEKYITEIKKIEIWLNDFCVLFDSLSGFFTVDGIDRERIRTFKKEMISEITLLVNELLAKKTIDDLLLLSEQVILEQISKIGTLCSEMVKIYNKYASLYSEIKSITLKTIDVFKEQNIESNYDLSGFLIIKRLFKNAAYKKIVKIIESVGPLLENTNSIFNENKNLLNCLQEVKRIDGYKDTNSLKDDLLALENKVSKNEIKNIGVIELSTVKENLIKFITDNRNEVTDLFLEMVKIKKFGYVFDESQTNKKLFSECNNAISYYNNEINAFKSELDSHFENYHKFITTYKSLNQQETKIINSLILDVQEVDRWKDYFKYFYFARISREIYDKTGTKFPKNGFILDEIIKLDDEIKKEQVKNIIERHAEKRRISILNSKMPINSLYNKKGTAGEKRKSLRTIINHDFNLFSSFFPVVMVNPSVCSSILPLKKGLFDVVLLDEASQLRVEDTLTAFIRGKQGIISGDEHQMPPTSYFGTEVLVEQDDDLDTSESSESYSISNHDKGTVLDLASSESLLSFGSKLGLTQSMLEIHYRSHHQHLIDFSNNAFYGGRLKAISDGRYQAIKFFNVSGIYDSDEGVNETESEKVIEILKDLMSKYEKENLPSIGIGTLNVFQRNLILSKIEELKSSSGDIGIKLNSYNNNTFFVKNLENIQGDERDIIILSTTFGIRKDGRFIKNYGVINQEQKGYRFLNVIATRAKKEIFMVTSIPEEYYSQYESEIRTNGVSGKGAGLFHSYLSYCKAASEHNEPKRTSILNLLLGIDYASEKKISMPYSSEMPFEEEVSQYLKLYIDEGRIRTGMNFHGTKLDIAILSKEKDKPIMAIECDLINNYGDDTAYCWDIFRRKICDLNGVRCHQIFSINWFQNLNLEIENLIKVIKESCL